ncbi:hypothetical protein HK102_001547 [Quaeritorhiza haematococci]|nr:hypothetical protein HK102_001547 [Quaeritorhiza haematococci]
MDSSSSSMSGVGASGGSGGAGDRVGNSGMGTIVNRGEAVGKPNAAPLGMGWEQELRRQITSYLSFQQSKTERSLNHTGLASANGIVTTNGVNGIDDGVGDVEEKLLVYGIEEMASRHADQLCVEKKSGVTVSCPYGLHFGKHNPNSSPLSRTVTLKNTSVTTTPKRSPKKSGTCGQNVQLRINRILTLPPRKEFSVSMETPTDNDSDFILEAGQSLNIVISARPGTDYGVFSTWLLILFADGSVVGRPIYLIVTNVEDDDFVPDVYSKPFIPQALIDLNSRPATLRPGPAPPQPNYGGYRLSITPPFLRERLAMFLQSPQQSGLAGFEPLSDDRALALMPPQLEMPTYVRHFGTLLMSEIHTRTYKRRKI